MRAKALMMTGGAMLMLMVGGCMTDGDRDRPGRPGPGPRECKADRAQSMIGRPADDRAIQSIRRMSHARTVRVVKPGQPVTMDFRPDRLTVEVDGRNRIVSARCG